MKPSVLLLDHTTKGLFYFFFRILKKKIRRANLAFLVYDVSKKESFETVKRWASEIEEQMGGVGIKVLVGNKSDLTSE